MKEKKSDDMNIELKPLKSLKIKFDPRMFSFPQLEPIYILEKMARIYYDEQSTENKKLPVCRFWKTPDTLQEKCIQFITSDMIENGSHYDRRKLTPELNELIDDKIKKVNDGLVGVQYIIEECNREIQEILRDLLERCPDLIKPW
jgi:hypothetical protein